MSLQVITELDFQWSQYCYNLGAGFVSQKVLHAIGWTGEGYFWLPVPGLVAWYYNAKGDVMGERVWSNLLLVNLIDIILIAGSKYFFKRQRPVYEASNKTAVFLGPDMHSFPSGHTSRAWTIALVLSHLLPGTPIPTFAFIWAITVTASRLLLGRHYIGDLLGGVVLALINFKIFTTIGPVGALSALWPFGEKFLLRKM
eukprot:TRINITY_DN5502_c0_g1_i1.p1 TRINITY_DN5502_c0_g1~~TRINITY_DN5502_c0_g1_i1.p1  ORF type:complete len:222 (+),score=39.61 TRINITY_DN5502_c0_g1_i1:72-668(+)